MNLKNCKIEYTRGKKKCGGRHRNSRECAVRITHLPTGISAFVDGRDQAKNKALAIKELEKRLKQAKQDELSKKKKEERDRKIKETPIIRTYDYKKGIVKDHRSKRKAALKDVLLKGDLDLLKPI